MTRVPLAQDTSLEVEQMQIESWRRMTPQQKADIVTDLTRTALTLTKIGIRDRFPNASPHEQRLRLALILLGRELAAKMFPDLDTLDLR